jgi:hypothetical protein
LRAKLQTVLTQAGPSGHTIQELRALFPDTKSTTLATTLSNLKRVRLVTTKGRRWVFCRETPVSEYSGTGSKDLASMGEEPERWHNVSERDYEVITHPGTGVSLARRA